MDDIVQVIFYIVIVLAGIAGPLIKNSKARKEQEAQRARRQQQMRHQEEQTSIEQEVVENQPSRPIPKTNPFEEFLRQQLEEFGEPEEHYATEEELVQKSEIEEEVPVDTVVSEGTAAFESTTDSMLSDNMSEEGFSISESVANVVDSSSDNDIYNYDYSDLKESEISDKNTEVESFDAKKALIYSEIFKRPKF